MQDIKTRLSSGDVQEKIILLMARSLLLLIKNTYFGYILMHILNVGLE